MLAKTFVNTDNNYYTLLNVSNTATLVEVKKAYRLLAKTLHPDVNPGGGEQFSLVAEAYAVLSDEKMRAAYDVSLTLGTSIDFRLLTEFLREAFMRDPWAPVVKPGEPVRGRDIHTTVTLPLEQLARRTPITVRISVETQCTPCKGSGTFDMSSTSCCHSCEGSGVISNKTIRSGIFDTVCEKCLGHGYLIVEKCVTCLGSGLTVQPRDVKVKLPQAVTTGMRLKIVGEGAPGRRNAAMGDLYLTLKILAHPTYTRIGADLTLVLPVGFNEAALGGAVQVPTVSGEPLWLRIPAGTENRQTFRVVNRGLPYDEKRNGDLYITISVQLPSRTPSSVQSQVSKPLVAS